MESRNPQRMTKSQLIEELAQIRQHLALFGATEQLAQIGHFEWDYNSGRLISCSEEYARIFGMSVELTMKLQDNWEKTFRLIHVDDRARYKGIVQSFPDSKLLDVEFRIVLRDGVIRHVRELGVIVTDEKGEDRGSFGVIQDITDRVKHHRDMANRDVLAQQAESITDIGHFIFDLISETYVYISPGFARIHGVSCEEYLARVSSQDDDISDVHEDDYARVAGVYEQH
ncbi:MAG: PAS domain-containing protein, partial [Gammaproteobacteria bacterium]